MLKVILDTNIFISGFLFGGIPEKVTDAWVAEGFVVCVSPQLMAEVMNKFIGKFRATESYINHLSFLLDNCTQKYTPMQKVTICEDPNDNFLLELASAAKAD